MGIEALSRGAAHACFLERNRAALAAIRENLAALGLEPRATVVAGPVRLTIARYPRRHRVPRPALRPGARIRRGARALADAAAAGLVQHSVRLELAESYGALAPHAQ